MQQLELLVVLVRLMQLAEHLCSTLAVVVAQQQLLGVQVVLVLAEMVQLLVLILLLVLVLKTEAVAVEVVAQEHLGQAVVVVLAVLGLSL
jgi:hypothetical protein